MRAVDSYERRTSFENGVCVYIAKQSFRFWRVVAKADRILEVYPDVASEVEADFIFKRLVEKYADADPSMIYELAEP